MSEATQGEIRDILGSIRDYYLGLGILATAPVDIGACKLGSTGAALGTFSGAGASTPGTVVEDSKALVVRWNDDATPTPLAFSWRIPDDMDRTEPWFLSSTAGKVGATEADATTLTVEAYLQEVGALHDADSDMGGATNALVGDADTKTVSELLFEFDPTDLPETADASITFLVGPTDGTLETDDFLMHSLAIQYVRKAS